MGVFDSKQEQKQFTELPAWLEGAPEDIKNRMMTLLDRPSISPEDRVAELDPLQQQGIEQLGGFGQEGGTGFDILQGLMGGAGGVEGGMAGLEGIMGQGPVEAQGIDMDYVRSLIDNDVLGEQIGAATRDTERRFSEVDAPQSRLMQALSGGTGSTRGAIGDAILQRGAMDRTADISGTMRGNAFAQALGLGGQRASQGGALELASRGQDIGAAGTMLQGGLASSGMAADVGMGNINAMIMGGGMNRSYEQALNDVEYQNWQRMYGDVAMGHGMFGEMTDIYGTDVSKTKSSMSPAAFGLGLASTLTGMPSFGGMGGGEDPFDFSEGGFFNPSSDYLSADSFS